jgi:hypothetical protein
MEEFPSDYAVLHFDMHLGRVTNRMPSRVVYNYKLCDSKAFIRELHSLSPVDMFSQCSDANGIWNVWFNTVTSAIDHNVPKVTTSNSREPPWFDSEVRHSLKCENNNNNNNNKFIQNT